MDKIKPVLEGIYSNKSLRSRVVPLFMEIPEMQDYCYNRVC